MLLIDIIITAERVGSLDVNPAADLEQMRALIQGMIKESQAYSNLTDWWFVDCEFMSIFITAYANTESMQIIIVKFSS